MIKYSFDKKLKPVILTHYCPSIKCLNPNRKIITQLYSSNLDYLINNTKFSYLTGAKKHISSQFIIFGSVNFNQTQVELNNVIFEKIYYFIN